MFHVMLVLPLLAAFGAAAFFMVTVPLCLGAGLQLIFSIFSKKRWILLLPAILGAAGVVLSLVYLLEVVGSDRSGHLLGGVLPVHLARLAHRHTDQGSGSSAGGQKSDRNNAALRSGGNRFMEEERFPALRKSPGGFL